MEREHELENAVSPRGDSIAQTGLRLSPQQRRLWAVSGGTAASPCRASAVLRLRGAQPYVHLVSALQRVVERFEILRLGVTPGEGPSGCVAVTRAAEISWEPDLSATAAESYAVAAEVLSLWLSRPMAFATGSALRAQRIAVDNRECLLVIELPALCADRRTFDLLACELARAWRNEELAEGEVLQYSDLAEELDSILEIEGAEVGQDFWRTQDYAALRVSDVPVSRDGSNSRCEQPVQWGEVRITTSIRVEDVAALGHAPETFALAAWQVVLARLVDRDRFAVGYVANGRVDPDLAEVLGPLARMVPCAANFEANERFEELLGRSAEFVQQAEAWQECFTWTLLSEVSSPFFEIAFEPAFEPPPELDSSGSAELAVELLSWRVWIEPCALLLTCSWFDGALEARFSYDPGLISSGDVRQLGERLRALMAHAVRAPGTRLADLELLSPVERQIVLVEPNDTAHAWGELTCLHEMVAAQVARTPERVAVEFNDRRLSYADLAERVERLADTLRRRGVGPEARVGICLNRTPEMIVAILAVFNAGGSYLPLDPDYPRERLVFMLADTPTTALITTRELAKQLPGTTPVLALDELSGESVAELVSLSAHSLGLDNLAYTIYTSGSTGLPKGATIPHRAIGNRLLWMCRRFPLYADDGVLQKTSFSFDASIWEIFVPLISGARLVLARPSGQADVAYMVDEIAQRRVTVMQLVPSVLKVFLDEPKVREANVLRRVFSGGEALHEELRGRFCTLLDAELINVYGPTEVSDAGTWWRCTRGPANAAGGVAPIGRPLDNVEVYVLGRSLQPVPAGQRGELYMGGIGVGRGYQSRPGLTAERFLPHAFGQRPGERLYRTGDLARWRPQGALDFLGRSDQQVKIRGFRIELGEVEALLSEHPWVRQAAVIAREDSVAGLRLVAYVVGRQVSTEPIARLPGGIDLLAVATPDGATSVLRRLNGVIRLLRQKLPEFMVPASLVLLSDMPRTPSGKIDRKALPTPERKTSAGDKLPRTPFEEVVANVFAEVLGLERVGARDNFFTLGGHSLLATRAASRLRRIFQVEIPVRQVFDTPRVDELAADVEALLRERSFIAAQISALPRDRSELPLSFAQQRLWFLAQLEPESTIYNVSGLVRLEGLLDVSVLAGAFQTIIARHEALRTVFATQAGEPVQRVGTPGPLDFSRIDLSAVNPFERDALSIRLALIDAQRPFDLEHGPLFRVALLRLKPERHLLSLHMHHIVSDAWSTEILVRELAILYRAGIEKGRARLPRLPIQYADFAYWQRFTWAEQARTEQLAYWRKQLAGMVPIELPTDRPRAVERRWRGAERWIEPSAELWGALRHRAAAQSLTLFMLTLATFELLLSRLTGQDDVAVGSPIANRNRRETEDLIGFFVNTLVLRLRLDGVERRDQLLRQTREVALGAYAHQDLPFEHLVSELQPERDLRHNPFVEVMFAVQNAPRATPELSGLRLEPVDSFLGAAPFEFSFDWLETAQGPRGLVIYDRDLFDATTIDRLIDHYLVLLTAVAEESDRRLADLPWLSSAQRHQVTVEWNDTADAGSVPVTLGVGGTLDALFRVSAERTPNATALVDGEEELSFSALAAGARRLARFLRRSLDFRGGDPIVAILLPRSRDLVVAILAVLEAGAAYLPLDPEYPETRLRAMMEDARVGILISHRDLAVSRGLEAPLTVDLDRDAEAIAAGDARPIAVADSSGAAYVLYTSGSTGRPKGVVVEHRAAVTYAVEMARRLGLRPSDRILQFASVSFDVLVEELFPTWVAGAAVVLMGGGGFPSYAELDALIERQALTGCELPAAYWHDWIAEIERRSATPPPSLRFVMVGCEKPLPERVARWLEFGRSMTYVFGLTETTITNTLYTARPDDPTVCLDLPIGRPLANQQARVLDGELHPVPIGVVGELYIGGDCLARGYLNCPAATAARLIPDLFALTPGARSFRTGDLARIRHGGQIDFLGRIDHQVHLRGFRIELGEVEAALDRLPGVRESRVLMRSDDAGHSRLLAWVLPTASSTPDAEGLRSALRASLPEHMVPSAVIVLEVFPLTPNGKVDLGALPDPAYEVSETRAPQTQLEELVAGVWCEVLGRDSCGVDVSFFELGGHSLLATQVVSRLRGTLGADLPLRRFFERPTVSDLAAAVAEARAEKSGAPAVPPIVRVPRCAEGMPLSFAQQRLWLIEQFETAPGLYNVPGALQLRGELDQRALASAFTEIEHRHEILRTVFTAADGEPRQWIQPTRSVLLPLVDLSRLGASSRDRGLSRLLYAEAVYGFDLARGPLWRVTLVRIAESEHVLLLTLHHVVSDAWSMDVLIRELAAFYEAARGGAKASLAELPIQYADYAIWQRDFLGGAVLERELSYWKTQLAGAAPLLELPTDRPRPARQSHHGAQLAVRMPARLLADLRAFGRRRGTTLFMTILAAYQALLGRLAGQHDVSVGSPIAGRNQLELEGLIGFFINTLVFRADLMGDPLFTDHLARVRESALGAYAHQELPFEKLVEELQPERSLAYVPLFQACLSLQNVQQTAVNFAALDLTALEIPNETSKFDLNLTLAEDDTGLLGWLEYSSDLFDRVSMRRLLASFEHLLESIVEGPERCLSALPLIGGAERHALLIERNASESQFPLWPVHEQLAAAAARHPERCAILVGSDEEAPYWTYLQLDQRANQLARRLQALGACRGTRIGLYVDQTPQALAALFAVLKTGAAYVPLDPGHPWRQTEHMLADAGIEIVVTQRVWRDRFAEGAAYALVELDRYVDEGDWPFAGESCGALNCAVGPGDLAYVIYTSGSTGRPKGVEVSHGALTDYTAWARNVYLRGEDIGFALCSSFAFDLTVTSIFPPIGEGRRVIVFRDRRDDPAVLRAAADPRVDLIKLTPSHLALMKNHDLHGSRVRRLIVGGEALTVELARQTLVSFGGGVEILNEYGPTEATVGCMLHRFDPMRDQRIQVPIGEPAANTRIYVLDRALEPMSENVIGELYIGGAGLARGYLGLAARTAATFVPDPFVPGERMYRSGDLARWLPGGGLGFVGRSDAQVKYHGFRVELGALESALNEHPKARSSVVRICQDERSGGTVLVAYYVARQEIPSRELRAHLSSRVIEETIPSFFVHLRRMPLTLNGKVNLEALPGLTEIRGGLKRVHEAPRTPIEEMLVEIWGKVLGFASESGLGALDNFFDLGGHSLLATQVIARLRSRLGVDLPLSRLFEAPTVRAFARQVENALGGSTLPPIVRRDIPSGVPRPLSFAQQRLWLIDQLEPESALYNLPLALELGGELDVGALLRALAGVVQRHETLQTIFPQIGGEARQRVVATQISLPVVDLQVPNDSDRQRCLATLLAAEASAPFDLARGPLWRAQLLRLAERRHVLTLTLHHITADAWSIDILVRELATLYSRAVEGVDGGDEGVVLAAALESLPVRYADYAEWQREVLQGPLLEREISWWREQLAGSPPRLDLPTDRARPARPSRHGAHRPVRFAPAAVEGLLALARSCGATLFMALLGSFAAFLARLSNSRDVNVGTPIAGRHQLEVEGLIGFFVNTLVVRLRLEGAPGLRQIIERARDFVLAAHAHQELPFERLVEELRPERSLSHTPLFQVVIMLDRNGRQNAPAPGGLELRPIAVPGANAKFDLLLAFVEHGKEVSGTVEYSTELFDDTTVGRWMGHYSHWLSAALADPERPWDAFALLDAAQSAQVLAEWNDTRYTPCPPLDLALRFAAMAAAFPETIALEGSEANGTSSVQLSYGELARRANRMAHHLVALGVGPEVAVGLLLRRSPELITALLGVLGAGGCYVPLDPNYPLSRLTFMLDSLRAPVVICEEDLLEFLGPGPWTTVCSTRDRAEIGRWPITPPPAALGATHRLAYVIFTSGSTGRPKGVAVAQPGILRLVDRPNYARFDRDEIFLQLASISFDAATLEIWAPLLNGGRLTLPPPQPPTLEQLARWISRYRISTLWLTAGLFHQMVDEQLESLAGARQLLAGGDVLSVPHCARVLTRLPGVTLINGYGPTEATTFVACHPMCGGTSALRESVPIGRPITETAVRIFDRSLRLVPPGGVGELSVGGAGLARGYFGQPGRTAESFIPDLNGAPGKRLYRTGDLAAWQTDGTLKIFGRRDHQVKIRGFRVELGEIETALRGHPAVGDAVVVLRRMAAEQATPGADRQLVAYIVAAVPDEEGKAPNEAELRTLLRTELPEHMVPAAFVWLPELPLDPNGKIDRRALPAPDLSSSALTGAGVVALHPLAEIVGPIWCEILGIDGVGAEADFFALGGHSLLATRVISRLRSALQVELPLRAIFEAPTLNALCRRLEEARLIEDGEGILESSPVSEPQLVALSPERRRSGVALSDAQSRLWFFDRLEPGSPIYNVTVAWRLALLADAPHVALLDACLNEIVRRHEILRTRYVDHRDQPLQVVDLWESHSLPVVDLRALDPSQGRTAAEQWIQTAGLRPFDLEHGPVYRAMLLRLAPDDFILVVVLHHIACDAGSLEIFADELRALYGAGSAGRTAPLRTLSVQYGDFAVWQREWQRDAVVAADLAFWRSQLADAPPLLDLPTDRPRSVERSPLGASHLLRVPPGVSEALRSLGQRYGTTLFLTLAAAFQALLARLAGCEDVSLGTPVSGRRHQELENLIGFFVDTLVLRSRPRLDASFADLLGEVRETFLAADAHRGLPFERLVQELEPERSLSHTPLFQVMFTLGRVAARNPGGALELQSLAVGATTSRFDIELDLLESAEDPALEGTLLYSCDLFDATTVCRIREQLLLLLESIAAVPEQPLGDHPLLTAAARQQTIVEWTGASLGTIDALFPELFAEQAARRPDAVALEVPADGQIFTYRDLDRRANRLAWRLRRHGVGPEVRVGVLTERAAELPIGLLAALKADGVYVPLDPSYPAPRLEYLCTAAGVAVVLTHRGLAARHELNVPTLAVDDFEALITDENEESPPSRLEADSAAYMIFTSGSTGRPKGVVVGHRALAWLTAMVRQIAGIGLTTRSLQFASPSFDISLEEIALGWSAGGTLVLHDGTLEVVEFARCCSAWRITHLDLPTSYWHELAHGLASVPEFLPGSLDHVIFGGERVLPQRVVEWQRAAPGRARIVNTYGPTETTVSTTCCDLTASRAVLEPAADLPIGRPLPGTWVKVLDRRGRAVPLGAPGELCIGGANLARGYGGLPAATAERFIPDTARISGGRLYRTGDLARFMADGQIAFLGRVDQQVKVRGFRVEPGEVETTISRLPGVRSVAVLAVAEKGVGQRLVAYVVREPDGPEPHVLLRTLSEQVPGYLVPSVIVELDAIPMTPNRKIDRKALPAPAPATLATAVAPHTPTEEIVLGIWREVLDGPSGSVPGTDGASPIGVEDDFFTLGGHSLLATRVVSRLRRIFNVEIPLRVLFEAPTVARLALAVERALRHSGVPALPPIDAVDRDAFAEGLPLSLEQQRLWFLAQLEPDSAAYNMPQAVRLRGAFDLAAFDAGLHEVVRRHETLRTVIRDLRGRPVQIVCPPRHLRWPLIDLGNLAESDRWCVARRWVQDEGWRPIDLAHGPHFQVYVLRLAEDDHVLLLRVHHIFSDGWSMTLLNSELRELYASAMQRTKARVPALPIQYGDYAAWQQRWLPGEVFEAQLAFWREQLAGAPARLELPFDRPISVPRSHRGDSRAIFLTPRLTQRLRRFGNANHATLFMTLLASFQALLARRCATTEVSVGTPVAGRHRLETENLIGFFVNTLVLRTDLAGDPSFSQLIERVRDVVLRAHTHQDVPFEKIVEDLQPERSLRHPPFFQTVFELEIRAETSGFAPGLEVEPLDIEIDTVKFDLTLALIDDGARLTGALMYAADYLDPTSIERLVRHWSNWLEGALDDPSRPYSAVPLLGSGERHQLVVERNDTAAPLSSLTLWQSLAARADLVPDAVAIRHREHCASYSELMRRAEHLAGALRTRGFGAESIVGLYAERSIETLVAQIAVLTAGAAYTPLPPDFPDARLRSLLDRLGVETVLVPPGAAPRLRRLGQETLVLGKAWEALDARPDRMRPSAGGRHLACAYHTSGSTGVPKSIAVEHRSLANHAIDLGERWRLGVDDVVLQLASPSFDASLRDGVMPLTHGCRIVQPCPEEAREPGMLWELLQRERVTCILACVPSLLAAILRGAPAQDIAASVRLVLVAGEAMPLTLVEAVRERFGARALLVNQYGPSECTLVSSSQPLAGGWLERGYAPLGRPLRNVGLRLVDGKGEPVPMGTAGEIWIHGAGLARGYPGHPAATARTFVPDPLGLGPGARLYRTGDLACWRSKKKLEFLGRRDRQVKLRGVRVELGEVETVLASHPAVEAAAVVVREPGQAAARPIAYLTVASDTAVPSEEELHAYLADRLTEVMLPTDYVVLPSFPRTHTGKIDHRALPEPKTPATVSAGRWTTAAMDPIERRLMSIWTELLGTSPRTPDDNFFRLGGHSLLAMHLVARIEEEFGTRLAMVALFQAPTVTELARLLRREEPVWELSPRIPIQPVGSGPQLHFVHPVGGHVLCYADLAVHLGPEQPFFAFSAESHTPRTQIGDMAQAYLEELCRALPSGPYLLGGWSMGGLIAYEMARRLELAGRTVDLLILVDSRVPSSHLESTGSRDTIYELGLFAEDLGLRAEHLVDEEAPTSTDPEELLELIHRLARRVGLIPPKLELERLRRLYELFRANQCAIREYVPAPYSGKLHLVRAAAGLRNGEDPSFGWRGLAQGGVDIHDIDADHLSIVREPHVQQLAQHVIRLIRPLGSFHNGGILDHGKN